jgi:amino acid adenylation domain-containing protein
VSGNKVRPINPFIRFDIQQLGQSIPSRFEHQVEKYPDRPAVRDKNRELTYKKLDRAANQIARAILDQGTPGEEPVALIFDLGPQAIAAILGVLKSGKPYVFLDPGLSSDRNDFILTDSGARLMVSDAANFSKASSYGGLSALNIDECPDTSRWSNERLVVAPDSPACLVYTSGSTGVPKGVVQTHRSLLAVTMNYTNCFHLTCEDRLSFFYSSGVIAAVRIMWLALCNGATLCIYDLRGDGILNLPDWLRQERITLFTSVASVFRNFTRILTEADQFPDLRLIRLGGEPTLPKDVESYKKHFSKNCLLVNRIGSTETGTYSWFCMDKETPIKGRTVPVGYPMEGYEISLLDEDGEEVGANQIGEIVVKSSYLPSGFWNRPELTEASFLPLPGGEERMYRTGDLGRRLPDGCLIHVGRKDHQVKMRGHRIEVAEIEEVLRSLDAVRETVVVPWKGPDGEQHLVAYFIAEAERTPSITALRRELTQKLPGYMVPAYFVQLDELPRAAGGKISRGALPSPGRLRPKLCVPLVAPRNATEVKLARLCAEVLGLDTVGVHDSFLELGGDSLRAMQLVSRMVDAFQIKLSVRALLDSPTIADMAQVLTLHQAGGANGSKHE